jgi:hypothetical protein
MFRAHNVERPGSKFMIFGAAIFLLFLLIAIIMLAECSGGS